MERNSLTSKIAITTKIFQIMSTKKPTFSKDHKQTKSLVEAGENAASMAIQHSKSLGLTIMYIENGAIYEERADGIIKFKKNMEKMEGSIELTKGMVLHAK